MSTSNTSTLLLVIVLFIFITLGLLLMVVRQKQQINDMQEASRPKYGFLGKPLVSMAVMALMVGGFGVTYFANQGVQDVSVSDGKSLVLEVKVEVGVRLDDLYSVDFTAVPNVNGIAWGGSDVEKFDIFWAMTGAKQTSQIELDLSQSKPGGFSRNLPAGTYEVQADTIFAGKTWTKKVSFTVP